MKQSNYRSLLSHILAVLQNKNVAISYLTEDNNDLFLSENYDHYKLFTTSSMVDDLKILSFVCVNQNLAVLYILWLPIIHSFLAKSSLLRIITRKKRNTCITVGMLFIQYGLVWFIVKQTSLGDTRTKVSSWPCASTKYSHTYLPR